jgi:hypothetical protein
MECQAPAVQYRRLARCPDAEALISRSGGLSIASRMRSTTAGESGCTASGGAERGARTSDSGLAMIAPFSAAWRRTLESSVRALWIVPGLTPALISAACHPDSSGAPNWPSGTSSSHGAM